MSPLTDTVDLHHLIKDLIDDVPQITAVYFFGSRRHGTRSTRSDIDLLVTTNEWVKPSDILAISRTISPALDVFVASEGTAISVTNESRVSRDTLTALIQELDAVELWNSSTGFLQPPNIDWSPKIAHAASFPATVLQNTSSEEAFNEHLRQVGDRGLPIRPYLGSDAFEAADIIELVIRRMVLAPEELGQKGTAKNGWTVHLANEYDFQNLFFTVVKPWLPNLSREDTAIIYDGQEKNADFSLFDSQLIIEMKFIKDQDDKREIVKTLNGLADFYRRHANARELIFCIFVAHSVDIDAHKWENDYSYPQRIPRVRTLVVVEK